MDIYAGRAEDALNNAEAVLGQSHDNREGLLLRSLCLIELGKLNRDEGLQFRLPFDVEKMEVDSSNMKEIENPYFRAASITLNDYLSKYPSKSAPALLLQGVLMMDTGNAQSALSYFDR